MPNKPAGDFTSGLTTRKARTRKPKDLPTINERSNSHNTLTKSPLSQRVETASNNSSVDVRDEGKMSRDGGSVSRMRSDGSGGTGEDGGSIGSFDSETRDGTRKLQKGQISSLAKMLTSLKR